MATHMFQTSPGGKIGPDTTLAPPAVIETDPNTRHVPSMLRIHIQDAKLPAGCNPYAVVSVGNNCARSKQLLSAENPALASTGHAFFDEQFVVEYDPKHMKETFVSVAFFERTTNAPLGEWRAPISDFDHHHHGILSHLPGKHQTDAGGHSWELIEGTNVPLAPYVGTALPHGHAHGHTHGGGLLSHLKPGHSHATTTTPVATVPVATTAPVATATAPVVATTPVLGTAVPVATTTPIPATTTPFVATTTPVGAAAPVTSAPMGTGVLGTAHIRVRSEPKLIGTLKLGVKEVILATGSIEPIILNIKFASPEQRFSTPLTPGVTGGRFAFTTNEFFLHVDPSNNVRDIFIEVMQNGVILGETRVTLYDAYRPGGLAAAQPILIHSTKSRIGEILLSSSFDGKVQKR